MRKAYSPRYADTVAWGERKIEDEIPDADAPRGPAVYALRLLQPQTKRKLKEEWTKWISDEVPSYAWAAYHADEVYYVGATGCLEERLRDHINPEGAEFLLAFPFWKVHSTRPCPTREVALKEEPKVADRVEANQDGDVFVYQK